jgi:hypothetical protein
MGDRVFDVVGGQCFTGGRGSGDIGIKRNLHGRSRDIVDRPTLLWAPRQIDDAADETISAGPRSNPETIPAHHCHMITTGFGHVSIVQPDLPRICDGSPG